jgi:aryl-alcohol dehydrogenase-like predicted oxidoreductase
MDYRQLGRSGLRVSALTLGTMTFGGRGDFAAVGARTDEQLRDNLGAADLTLTADERAALDKISAPDLIYPHWHQHATASDRLGPADLTLHAAN